MSEQNGAIGNNGVMSQVPYRYQPRPAVSSPGESLRSGWQFFTSNVAIASVLVGGGAVYEVIDRGFGERDASPSLLPILTQSLLVVVAQLALFRRAFDYWDERHGLAQPTEFPDALVGAMRGALPRIGAWIGWNLVLAVMMIAIWSPFLLIRGRSDSGIVIALALVATCLVTILALVYVGFVPTAVADREGNPFPRSFGVAQGNLWDVLSTFVMIALILIGGGQVIGLIAGTLADATAPLFGVVLAIGYSVIARSVVVGALVAMYRAVIPPEQPLTFDWGQR